MIRLSIIIPAYNVADYIEKCIRSLEDQDIPKSEFEIIVTNDGSPDHCREIVEDLQKEFPNIILVNQENQGVSVARNNAIVLAKGKYVMPIDPDDYVERNRLSQILNKAESQELDILVSGFEVLDVAGNSIWRTNFSQLQSRTFIGVDAYLASRNKDARDPDRSWAILYKRELLQKYAIDYPKGVPFLEDGCFLVKVFSVAEKVGFLDHVFYKRTTTEGSATVSGVFYSDKAIDGFINAAFNLKTFLKNNKLTLVQQGLVHHGIVKYTLLSLFQSVSLKSIGKFLATVGKIRTEDAITLPIHGVVEPYKKYAQYFNWSPYLFFVIYLKDKIVSKYLKSS